MHEHWHDLIPYYVAGTLPEDERDALAAHLLTCDECREAVDEWRLIADATVLQANARERSLPPLRPLPNVNSRFRQHAKKKGEIEMISDVMVRPVPNLRPVMLVMTALLLIFGGYFFFTLLPDGSQPLQLELLRGRSRSIPTPSTSMWMKSGTRAIWTN